MFLTFSRHFSYSTILFLLLQLVNNLKPLFFQLILLILTLSLCFGPCSPILHPLFSRFLTFSHHFYYSTILFLLLQLVNNFKPLFFQLILLIFTFSLCFGPCSPILLPFFSRFLTFSRHFYYSTILFLLLQLVNNFKPLFFQLILLISIFSLCFDPYSPLLNPFFSRFLTFLA